MIIQYPNLIFRWHNPRKGICGIEDYVTDFKNCKYGYDLKAGQCVYMVRCDSFYIYHVSIRKVTKEGITVSDYLEKGWGENDPLERLGITDGFLPWKFNDGDLEIEPCESLFENYKGKDLINGTCRTNENRWLGGKCIQDPKGDGIFYKHGGWRNAWSKYADNIHNIVKLGQMELDLDV